MTKQDRTTLKSFFRDGALPSAEHYRDLIDSGVNQIEDGFSKTPLEGLKLNSVGSSLRVLSLYEGLSAATPSWTVEHGATKEGQTPGGLHFRPIWDGQTDLDAPKAKPGSADANEKPNDKGATATKKAADAHGLSLTRDGRTGVNMPNPDWCLDVAGVARLKGRIGVTTPDIPSVDADGKWHDITRPMTGCQAFEIMAGAGGEKNAGHYALLHATAMNAYHPRNVLLNWLFGRRRIRSQNAVYGSFADRLKLRWVATEKQHHFKLQLRSNANYGKGKKIRYYLTRLWFDTEMEGSRGGSDRDEGLL